VNGDCPNRMTELSDVTLAVLAGGVGRRMGGPKANLQLAGRPILAWLLDRLQWPGPRMAVTAPVVPDLPGKDRFDRVAIDPIDGLGPLRGILTALENSTTQLVCTITVDMPRVDRRALSWLVEALKAAPATAGIMCSVDVAGERRIEPFPSIFRVSAADSIRAQLSGGRRSVRGLRCLPAFKIVPTPPDWPATLWTNLNDPAELAAFETSLQQSEKSHEASNTKQQHPRAINPQ